MSFFRCQQIQKTRKPHSCEYCSRTIQPGEPAQYVTGNMDGDLQSYYMCPRCAEVSDTYDNDGSGYYYLSCFADAMEEMVPCPTCGKKHMRVYPIDGKGYECRCECRNCSAVWTEDLSLERCEQLTIEWRAARIWKYRNG